MIERKARCQYRTAAYFSDVYDSHLSSDAVYGVLYVDYHANTILGIVFRKRCHSGRLCIHGNHAYHLQEKNVTWNQKHIKRILNFTILLAVLYVVRFTVLRGLFGFHNTKYFVDLFLMTGAWWYAWGYLALLWLAPIFQYILNHAKKGDLYTIVFGLTVAFVMAESSTKQGSLVI